MSNPKRHESNAERQAAYRRRNADSKPPTEAELASLARSLHIVIEEALEQGSTILPADVLGAHAGETLRISLAWGNSHLISHCRLRTEVPLP